MSGSARTGSAPAAGSDAGRRIDRGARGQRRRGRDRSRRQAGHGPALVGTLGMPYAVLMPVFASKILHGGAHTLGLLMTASGLGALMGTVYLAARHTVIGLGKVIIWATVIA